MRKLLCFIVLLNCFYLNLFSQPNEYIIKGVFLEKFTRFIDWPEYSDVNDTLKPFIIGVVGKDPFQSKLSHLYEDRKIKKKIVLVKQITSNEQLEECHLLFIADSESYRFSRILKTVQDKPILTVGDSNKFSQRGIIINLKIQDNRIRFEIDESAAHKSGLHFSHLLLKEADIVNPLR